MNHPMTKRCFSAIALAALVLLAACHDRQQAQLPNRANFTTALNDYLTLRGHLCLAKYDWPITVTAADRAARSLDAQQMPVLETLGLAQGRDVGDAASAAREYKLTDEGSKYYVHTPVVIVTATQHLTHPADFCAATLTLDRIVGWEKPLTLDGRTVTSVLFTYRIEPAPWARTPEALRVFPVIANAIANAGTQQLRLGVHLTPRGWIADELAD